jgi:hypothetical protein
VGRGGPPEPPDRHAGDHLLIQYQGLGDLYRIYAISERDGVDYNLAYIPSTFRTAHTSEFDTAYMRQLFDLGYGMAAAGYPWAKRPPILVSGEGDAPKASRP